MWYHYLAGLIGAYLVITGIVYLISDLRKGHKFVGLGWVMWSIPRLIGLALLWWAWNGVNAPVAPPMMGGKRRWY